MLRYELVLVNLAVAHPAFFLQHESQLPLNWDMKELGNARAFNDVPAARRGNLRILA